MFNETSYFGDRTPECQAIKDNCDSRFPVSSDPEVAAGTNPLKPDLNWNCMKTTGYVTKCMGSKGYATPGGDNYLIDTFTNPDNPDYVLPNFGLGSMNTPTLLAIGVAILGGLLLLRR